MSGGKGSKLNFTTDAPQPYHGHGGEQVIVCAGKCVVCSRRVYQIQGEGEPDPRGAIPPRHALAELRPEEWDGQHAVIYDATIPPVTFCYRMSAE